MNYLVSCSKRSPESGKGQPATAPDYTPMGRPPPPVPSASPRPLAGSLAIAPHSPESHPWEQQPPRGQACSRRAASWEALCWPPTTQSPSAHPLLWTPPGPRLPRARVSVTDSPRRPRPLLQITGPAPCTTRCTEGDPVTPAGRRIGEQGGSTEPVREV